MSRPPDSLGSPQPADGERENLFKVLRARPKVLVVGGVALGLVAVLAIRSSGGGGAGIRQESVGGAKDATTGSCEQIVSGWLFPITEARTFQEANDITLILTQQANGKYDVSGEPRYTLINAMNAVYTTITNEGREAAITYAGELVGRMCGDAEYRNQIEDAGP